MMATPRGESRAFQHALLLLSLLALTACTAYTPPPLTTAHPAHPEAVTVPDEPPSNTLAYGASDMPSPQPVVAMAQRAAAEAPVSQADEKAVTGEGNVIAVVPGSHQIVVDHKAIKGFMDAMTMGYRVEPPSLLEGVKAGDKIHFTIDPQKNAIVQIEKMDQ